MNEDLRCVDYIEKLRIEKELSIKDLTSGVISPRTYTRYLSNQVEIPLDILNKFLERLETPLYQFGLYIYNTIYLENSEEIVFFNLIVSEKYKRAYEQEYPKLKDKKFQTYLSGKALPLSILLMKCKLNIITENHMLVEMRNVLELNALINRKDINAGEIEALKIFVKVCNDTEKELISNMLYKYLSDKSYMILTNTVEVSRVSLYYVSLLAYTTRSKLRKADKAKIEWIVKDFLKYHKRAKTLLLDCMVLKLIYDYYNKHQLSNDLIVFHYVAAILSTPENDHTKQFRSDITEANIRILFKFLEDDTFLKESMYERLLANELL